MSQKIYFVQHGLALDKSVDAKRPLSPAGIQQTKLIAEVLRKSTTNINHVFHSGKLRAKQTAEIMATSLNVSKISAAPGLSPNDDISIVADLLAADNVTTDDNLYVGHLPHLGKLVSYLLNGNDVNETDRENIVQFQNSAVLCLQKKSHGYQLCWYLTPDLLAGL